MKSDLSNSVPPSARTIGSPTPRLQPAAATVAATQAAGIRILLVEDHDDTRRVMEGLLRRDRHAVDGVSTAADAIQLAEAKTYDLVISDLGLPDQSGVEMMAQLRDRHGLRGIAVSGYGMEDDVARSRKAGFSFHLTKPIRLDRLRAIILQVVADRDAAVPN